jgi:hypothetical protein
LGLANIFIFTILYGFCLLPAEICNEIIHILNSENETEILDKCVS